MGPFWGHFGSILVILGHFGPILDLGPSFWTPKGVQTLPPWSGLVVPTGFSSGPFWEVVDGDHLGGDLGEGTSLLGGQFRPSERVFIHWSPQTREISYHHFEGHFGHLEVILTSKWVWRSHLEDPNVTREDPILDRGWRRGPILSIFGQYERLNLVGGSSHMDYEIFLHSSGIFH